MDNSLVAKKADQESVSSKDADSSSAKKRKQRNVLLIVAALAAAVCLVMGICVIAGGWRTGTSLREMARDQEEIATVIDEFMREMELENAAAAYDLFSARARRELSLSSVQELLEGDNYALFEGYENAEVTASTFKTTAVSLWSDPPPGKVAHVEGTVAYEGGITGHFSAVLEEEGSIWRLFQMHVTAPTSKFTSP